MSPNKEQILWVNPIENNWHLQKPWLLGSCDSSDSVTSLSSAASQLQCSLCKLRSNFLQGSLKANFSRWQIPFVQTPLTCHEKFHYIKGTIKQGVVASLLFIHRGYLCEFQNDFYRLFWANSLFRIDCQYDTFLFHIIMFLHWLMHFVVFLIPLWCYLVLMWRWWPKLGYSTLGAGNTSGPRSNEHSLKLDNGTGIVFDVEEAPCQVWSC